jgi:hypothetical protein
LVYFQPTAVPEAQEFQFDRYTVEGKITVTTGIDNPSVLPVILIWAQAKITARSSMTARRRRPLKQRVRDVRAILVPRLVIVAIACVLLTVLGCGLPGTVTHGARECVAGYSVCLNPNKSDYDCAGGSGNGPGYVDAVRVTGSDPFDLDRDGNGYGCEGG